MKKIILILSSVLLQMTAFHVHAFDQNALDRLYAGDSNLAAADFSGANIGFPPNQPTYVYTGIDFTGADFSNARIIGRRFENCDFTNAVFTGGTVRSCHFIKCTLRRTNFSNVSAPFLIINNYGASKSVQHLSFAGSDLSNAQLITSIQGVDFTNANLTHAAFRYGTLRSNTYDNTNFNQTQFSFLNIHVSLKSFFDRQSVTYNQVEWFSAPAKIKDSGMNDVKKVTPKLPAPLQKGKIKIQ